MKDAIDEQFHGSYSLVTHDVRVTITPQFLEERSDIDSDVYVFTYEVTIENHGTETIQLLNRHWIVMAGGQQHADIKGDGVVGEQPILETGEGFTYASFTVVNQPVGSMFGTYTFRSESGAFFDVMIPESDLIYVDPTLVH